MTPEELVEQLVRVTDDVGAVARPPAVHDQLVALCATARRALGAASVSVARLTGTVLVYEAADGEGADGIFGTELPLTQGIGGYVARTGQAMIVDRVVDDPRFAREVAESTGYVPTSLLVAPVVGPEGGVIGVVSVLDRGETHAGDDALSITSSVAAQAALLLPTVDTVIRLGPLLLEGLAAAVGDEIDLAAALRDLADAEVAATDTAGADDDLATVTALVAEVRTLGPEARATVERVLADLLSLARSGRR